MGRKCCAAGCKSNYANTSEYVTVFKFPSDIEQKKLWVKQIRRENFEPSASAVLCIKHFEESFIIREDRIQRSDGSELVVPRKKITLVAGAYPTRFENLPAYFNSTAAPKRKNPDDRRDEINERDDENFRTWCKNDTISSVIDFCEKCKNKVPEDWIQIIRKQSDADMEIFARRKRSYYYFGDFDENDMSTPKTAVQILRKAKEDREKNDKKLKELKLQNENLEKRVLTLSKTVKEMEKRLLKSNTASDILESQKTVSSEKEKKTDHVPLETAVVIKEEPTDYQPISSSSTDPANQEQILHRKKDTWTTLDSTVEPQFTLSVACLAYPKAPETSDEEQLKKKRKIDSSLVPSTDSSNAMPQNPVHYFGESSNPASSKETRGKDEFDTFGEYIACKLRKLDRRARVCAEKASGDIALAAERVKYLPERMAEYSLEFLRNEKSRQSVSCDSTNSSEAIPQSPQL